MVTITIHFKGNEEASLLEFISSAAVLEFDWSNIRSIAFDKTDSD